MKTTETIEARVVAIESRNNRVELDKAWEGSWTRKVAIMVLTYFVVVVYLFVIDNENPWINAIVPPVGFFLSTLAITRLRQIWQSKQQ
jgi:hypothetical protein